jgi:hypothetical protein
MGSELMVDSTVLAHVLSLLNQRYDYGLDLYLLSIDEGITGYRDDSLEVSYTSPYSGLKLISDGEAESDRIRPTTKDPKLQRTIRMDNGQDRITSRQEE